MVGADAGGLTNLFDSCTKAKVLQTCDKLRCPGGVLCDTKKLSTGEREEVVRDGWCNVRFP